MQTTERKHINLRGISKDDRYKMSFTDKAKECLKFYFNQFGTDKLIIFIDGIDELTMEEANFLQYIPNENDVPENIYFFVMCRNLSEQIPVPAANFCVYHNFTDKVSFDRSKENLVLLKKHICNVFGYDEAFACRLAKALDYRFSALPLLTILEKKILINY